MRVKAKAWMAACAAALGLGGCAAGLDIGYYWQSATGHLALLNAARPVPDWVGAQDAPDKLKERLTLSQHIRRFASDQLGLPDNASYTRYADLQRPAALWNVVAAPELSLKLETWCFPIAGCIGYRGYYDEEKAQVEAQRLRRRGLEASVYPVPAYSTLGWLNWMGGDPLLNTFINYPEVELARLIFHELAHQVLYVANDTTFNESFATAVERLGVQRYIAQAASPSSRSKEWLDYSERRRELRALARRTREQLKSIYDSPLAPEQQREQKAATLREFRAEYARLREKWGGDPQRFRLSDRWVAQANNASFGAQAAYDELVPGFEALFEQQGGDWGRFYEAARKLAGQSKSERHRHLKELGHGRPDTSPS